MTNQFMFHYNMGYCEIFVRFKGEVLSAWISVDDFDIADSMSGTWCAKWNQTANTHYVRCQVGGRKHRRNVYLHRLITGVTGTKVQVDHDDHNGLNNVRSNLKVTDVKGNGFNRRGAERGSKSGRRNVYWNAREQKWMVWAVCMGRRYYVGYFENVDEADKAAQKLRVSLGGKV